MSGLYYFFLDLLDIFLIYIFAYVLQSLDLSFITNFQYSQLVWASLINVYFFNDLNSSKIVIILIILFGDFQKILKIKI